MKLFAFLTTLVLFVCVAQAQRVYPSHWYTGMKDRRLQLLIHDSTEIGKNVQFRSSSKDVRVVKVNTVSNPRYLFVDLELAATARPQELVFTYGVAGKTQRRLTYQLKARHSGNGKERVKGVHAEDFVYLMLPERFSNGDPANDVIPGYRSNTADRANRYDRHGGDFKGIQNNFDYLQNLGITTIWMTPVIENDVTMMHEFGNNVAGYHGYWFTDHYQIDKRFGGNDGYQEFCDAAHRRGLKVIQDAVYNHVSKEHWFVLDPPTDDWINNWPSFQGPSHREEVLFDPYASAYDRKVMLDGWFVDHLPDLNQRNPFLATYLIQHAIWTTENFGIDGWRVDTYKYCDEAFLNKVNEALYREFPAITILGEAWVNSVVGNAYFTRNNIQTPFRHNADGVIDFQTCFAMLAGMNKAEGWTDGVNKIYSTLAQDVVYKDPMHNCIFLDNHDMDRVFSVAGEDPERLKMALNWLLTLRGIPQLYYGTEVLMKNFKNPNDAMVRMDFPGGWAGDSVNKFSRSGRTSLEDSIYTYISKLAQFRKQSPALTRGKMMQFIPRNNFYVYFRYTPEQTVMVMANTGNKPGEMRWKEWAERTKGFTKARDVISGKVVAIENIRVKEGESFVFELLK
ncbi:alpha-amylase family glycosyl hydrolase [Terrimonas ferruginea]|uniref:alpha-amylase family glycosyl hydrolase n=1 Tax=Terrimonas ferruginea TaxID=249 RepID=UPI00040DFE48|nr:alpha-amylase family glycosyl hydrolase [Terrimonas ferruginea]